jgi:beta-1,4-mannosyl-glycoprotein beta-1,4-N-acetylglucosaminyltransferase
MDYRVGQYLVHGDIVPVSVPRIPSEHPQSLCIIETRQSFWLPYVIQNAIKEFPDWLLFVCAPIDVLQWLAPQFPQMNPVVIQNTQRSRNVFNQMMYSLDFWKLFSTPYVMMFQCDSIFVPGASQRVPTELKHAVYGAACGRLAPDEFIINGGLGLRHVETYKKACDSLSPEDMAEYDEDVNFTRIFRRMGVSLPTIEECMNFAIESYGNPSTVIGIHGTDKGYCPRWLLRSALCQKSVSYIVDCVPYDGEPILKTRLSLLSPIVDTFIVVESTLTHSGKPKELEYPKQFPEGHPKVVYVVVDTYPDMPPDFGSTSSWIRPESQMAWWRERIQRDTAKKYVPPHADLIIVSDVDEIPNPETLYAIGCPRSCLHLDMDFLVYSAQWKKPQEKWTRAFVCSSHTMPESFTDERCTSHPKVIPDGGWHCSSFFNTETQIRKIQHFAHREFEDEIDPDVIATRISEGRDPYGRSGYDAVQTTEHIWLHILHSN